MSKRINEVKEHDGCVDCKYISIKINHRPCKNCTSNYKQPNRYPDLWEENIEEIEEPTQGPPNPIRPNHYRNCSIECIDAMILTFGTDVVAEFCLVNAFKYIWRYKDKNGLEDIEKANWYVLKAIELGGVNDTIDNLYLLIKKIKEEYNAEEN